MKFISFLTCLLLTIMISTWADAQNMSREEAYKASQKTEVWEPVPPIVTPGYHQGPPSDAIVLFDGTDLLSWKNAKEGPATWTVAEGRITCKPGTGGITTKREFGDIQLHIEWKTPVDTAGLEGQERGNSGIFFMDRYEVQVLDNYKNPTYVNGQAGSVYKQQIPMANACLPPGEWQTYDIIFIAPRFKSDGSVETPAYVTVLHNGVLVQNHTEIKGSTAWIGAPKYEEHEAMLPLSLQDHGNYISYRNIWVREL